MCVLEVHRRFGRKLVGISVGFFVTACKDLCKSTTAVQVIPRKYLQKHVSVNMSKEVYTWYQVDVPEIIMFATHVLPGMLIKREISKFTPGRLESAVVARGRQCL